MANDTQDIHLSIAGKTYPMTIKREDEALIREAAKLLQNKMNHYRQYFKASVDDKDLLVMIALQLFVDNRRLEQRNDVGPFVEKIETLNDQLKAYLETR